MCQTVHVPKRAVNAWVNFPKRQTGSHADLSNAPQRIVAVDIFLPKSNVAQNVRHNFGRPKLNREIDLLPRVESGTRCVRFPRQRIKLRKVCRIGRRICNSKSCVTEARPAMPNRAISKQRLANDEVVGSWQPARLSEKIVDLIVRCQVETLRTDVSFKPNSGFRILGGVPFTFVELLKKVSIRNESQLGSENIAWTKGVSMLPNAAETKIFFGNKIASSSSQKVSPVVVDVPTLCLLYTSDAADE